MISVISNKYTKDDCENLFKILVNVSKFMKCTLDENGMADCGNCGHIRLCKDITRFTQIVTENINNDNTLDYLMVFTTDQDNENSISYDANKSITINLNCDK